MLKRKFILVLALLSVALTVQAQTGSISGKVIDAKTGEEITGATVYLKGKMHLGTMSDFEGRFLMENIPYGSDTLVVSVMSMANFIKPVTINSTTTLVIDVALVESITEIETVVFTGKVKPKTIASVYLEQKKLAYSINGIAGDAFKEIPVSNSGEALKLVSGATIQGGKFAIIRGLNERYNLAMINSSPLPSTEPEKRAFSLDLFPSNMLDQLLIVKSGSPEFPGDWAGGIILLRTKDVPEDSFFTIGMSSSINSLTTFKPFQQTEKLEYDWIGMGNKARELPDGFPSTQDIFTAKNTNRAQLADYAKMLPNRYAFSETSALPNASVNVSGGKSYKLGKSDKNRLGVIFSALYGNSRAFKPAERYWWTTNGMRALRYTDSTYESDTRLGAMLNFTFKLGKKSTFSLKNTYNHNGEDQFTKRSGARDAEGTFLRSFSYQYTYNRMFYTQLSGEHVFSPSTEKKKDRPVFDFASSTLNWEASYGNTLRNMPDYRNVEYQSQDPAEEPFRLKLLPQNGSEDVSRLFTSLNEDIKGLSIKLETPYEFNPMWSGSIKAGYVHQFKNRYFNGRFLSYSRPSTGFKFDLLQLPVGVLFDPSSFFYNGSGGPNGILMDEITRPYHSYFAQASLNAGFVQIETKYGLKHRLIYGARMESYHQVLESKGQNGEDIRIDTIWKNVLPSVNYVYELNDKTNIRASYFRSLSRPDFRELAPFSFLDFQTFSILKGNPDLKLTTIDNAEIRYEVYPKPSEVYSISVFYKRFENPIELLLDNSITLGAIGRLYANLPLANSFGIELDFRKKLSFIDSMTHASFFSQLTVYGNLTYIKSTIDLQGQTNTFNAKRPMQGQSPYIVNIGLQWDSKNDKWTASALVNRYGERIYNVGTATLPDIYEKARTVVDMQLSRKLAKDRLEVKISLQDLLAQDLLYFFDYDSNKKYGVTEDRVVYQYKMPRTIGFGASYKF